MNDWKSIDSKYVWHPYSEHPLPDQRVLLTHAKGAYVFDEAGKAYLDAVSSWWCNLHGHCHPKLVEALYSQAKTLDQVLFAPHAHPLALQLAERIVGVLGQPFSKVFFSDNGSTAVEAAMKMAVQYWHNKGQTGRNRFLSLENAYHGDTLGAISVSHVSAFHHYFEGLMMPSYKVPVPFPYNRPGDLTQQQYEESCLSRARDIVSAKSDEIAALIVEPLMQGGGGMINHRPQFLQSLTQLCQQYGILVIFDEVFTGFGRTGKMFAMEHIEARPDIVCLSKGLTSGMLPLSLTVSTDEVFDAFSGSAKRTFYNGHTFTANALGCAVALASLQVFENEKVLERNQPLMEVMASQKERFLELPHVGEVRQQGMIWVMELVRKKGSRDIGTPANGPGWRIAQKMWQQGFWLRPLNQILYVIPPYCTEPKELETLFNALHSQAALESNFEGFDGWT